MEDYMKKLKIFWKSRYTWVCAFNYWYELMYPHIRRGLKWSYNEFEEKDNAYWFWVVLSNFQNEFDGLEFE